MCSIRYTHALRVFLGRTDAASGGPRRAAAGTTAGDGTRAAPVKGKGTTGNSRNSLQVARLVNDDCLHCRDCSLPWWGIALSGSIIRFAVSLQSSDQMTTIRELLEYQKILISGRFLLARGDRVFEPGLRS